MDTPSLTGRPLGQDDRPFVSRVWNDERVAPALGGERTDEQLRNRIDEWVDHWRTHGFGATLFRERESREPVGWGGLQRSTIGIGECLTTGYVIAPSVWGRGYATEIATASVAYAFDVLAADCLYASILSTNMASRRVVEKAGLTLYRELDHGTHVEVVYAIAR